MFKSCLLSRLLLLKMSATVWLSQDQKWGLRDAVSRPDEHFVRRKDVNSAFDMTVNN